ncbi:hypothetical protein GCM10012275_29430 [Longimycelium tulufanense]|uniref:Uncharacterized protein n=1 Tax=Longimycelium tulufanense TaxID=907463 RepID=A0A8J3CF44_9PSEU|nr:DUF6191 domain-containing protein [Longimycelium tulufanense]GGM56415.1 hypothetical protein GCM10012275_29430 [Longimycelium tulufanense]
MWLGELFSSGARHQREHREWSLLYRRGQYEAGADPLDLDSGVVRLERRRPAEESD